jgi:hypothetical protein
MFIHPKVFYFHSCKTISNIDIKLTLENCRKSLLGYNRKNIIYVAHQCHIFMNFFRWDLV